MKVPNLILELELRCIYSILLSILDVYGKLISEKVPILDIIGTFKK